jgi:surfactin synthase thioesterase subunit
MPVEFPGRSTRAGEANAESMPELVSALVDGLMPAFEERPFAFFGHSFGTWVAFAVAQELQARGGPLPQKLYASAMRSPSLAAPEHDAEGDGLLMHTLGPDEFWAAMTRRYGQFSEQQVRLLSSQRAAAVGVACAPAALPPTSPPPCSPCRPTPLCAL